VNAKLTDVTTYSFNTDQASILLNRAKAVIGYMAEKMTNLFDFSDHLRSPSRTQLQLHL
jgi:hypothetical protein